MIFSADNIKNIINNDLDEDFEVISKKSNEITILLEEKWFKLKGSLNIKKLKKDIFTLEYHGDDNNELSYECEGLEETYDKIIEIITEWINAYSPEHEEKKFFNF